MKDGARDRYQSSKHLSIQRVVPNDYANPIVKGWNIHRLLFTGTNIHMHTTLLP